MRLAAELSLLALSILPWLAAFPLVARLVPHKPRAVQLDWFQIAGYAVIALGGTAASSRRSGAGEAIRREHRDLGVVLFS